MGEERIDRLRHGRPITRQRVRSDGVGVPAQMFVMIWARCRTGIRAGCEGLPGSGTEGFLSGKAGPKNAS
jgi:hypothetical protein